MKALKGLLIYIGLVLGIILGLGLILLCVMYFVPSFRIAGVGLIHYNKKTEEEVISLSNYSGYDNVVLNISSEKIDINVIPTEEKTLAYSMDLGIFGFSTERVEYKLVKQINVDNNTLYIHLNVTEPSGAISTGQSNVRIKVPTELIFGLVTNTKSGSVNIGHKDYPLALTDLSVSTSNGDLELINIGEGEEEKSLELNTLSLTTSKGEFDLSSINNLTVKNKVKLVAKDGEFVFKNLFASLDITGSGIKIEANTIRCGTNGFSFIAESGVFKIGTLSCDTTAENTIIAENLSINIDEISGRTGIVTEYGDINIKTLNGYTIIEDVNGHVTIGTARDSVGVKTKMGNIKVDAYYATGRFSSDKGDIIVNSRAEFNEEYYTDIRNVDGNVKVKNDINRLLITTTGRSNVVVAFAKIKDGSVFQHKINTNTTQGNCVVYLPIVNIVPFRFVAKGIISGEVGGYKISAGEGDQYYPEKANKVQADKNCCFEFVGRIEFKSHTREGDISGFEI